MSDEETGFSEGFWGLTLHPKKTYTQIVEVPFNLTMAALGVKIEGKERSCVMVEVEGKQYVLCSLYPEKVEQCSLDHLFSEGEEVTFSVTGTNAVHLTGYHIPHNDEMDDEDDEDFYGEMDGEDDEEIDSDELEGMMMEGEDDDEDDEDDLEGKIKEIDSDEEKEIKGQKKRKAEDKPEAKQPEKKTKEAKKEQPKKEQPKQEAKKEQPKAEQKPKEKEQPKADKAAQPQKKTLQGGLVVEDSKVGQGKVAKKGNKVSVRYVGKLASNGKVFDSNQKGSPFTFALGKGEVIKGWDLGVEGMMEGGERKLTIPAELAYGKKGAPPEIPPNAKLVFEVKLLKIN